MPLRITARGPLQQATLRGKTVILAAPGDSLAPAVLPIKPVASGGAQEILGAGQIATADAFGAPVVAGTIAAAGLATAEVHGQPALAAGIAGSGIASAEAAGAPAIAAVLVGGSVASAEAIGQPIVAPAVSAHDIAGAGAISSGEAYGLHAVCAVLDAASLSDAEAFGGAALESMVLAAGIGSAEAHGALDLQIVVAGPGQIASAESIGLPAVAIVGSDLNIAGAGGISGADDFGFPIVEALAGQVGSRIYETPEERERMFREHWGYLDGLREIQIRIADDVRGARTVSIRADMPITAEIAGRAMRGMVKPEPQTVADILGDPEALAMLAILIDEAVDE